MKTCNQCGLSKPESQFYSDKWQRDLLTTRCKDCVRVASKSSYKRNPRNYSPEITGTKICTVCSMEKEITLFPLDKGNYDGRKGQCSDCYLSASRLRARASFTRRKTLWNLRMQDPTYKSKRNAYQRSQYQKHRAKCNARSKLEYAVRTGKIVRQPCEVCSSTNSQAHHDDYSKPFQVRWFCQTHHSGLHRKYA